MVADSDTEVMPQPQPPYSARGSEPPYSPPEAEQEEEAANARYPPPVGYQFQFEEDYEERPPASAGPGARMEHEVNTKEGMNVDLTCMNIGTMPGNTQVHCIIVELQTKLREVFNVKALVGTFNQEKALVGAFSVITNHYVSRRCGAGLTGQRLTPGTRGPRACCTSAAPRGRTRASTCAR